MCDVIIRINQSKLNFLTQKKNLDEIRNKNKKRQSQAGGSTGELDQVTGTAEDEFSEAIHQIREHELLFGHKSLLNIYGNVIAHVCANNTTYTVCISV